MRKTTLISCLGTLLLGTVPADARAQQITSPYEYIEKGQEANIFLAALSPSQGRFGFGPGDGILMGGRYAVEVSGAFALEGAVGYFSGNRDVIDPSRDEGDRNIGEVDAKMYQIDARIRFALTGRRTWNRLNPYLVFGGGLLFDASSANDLDEELEAGDEFDLGTEFAASFGGGMRVLLGPRLALRPEVGVQLYRLETPSGYFLDERGFEAVAESEWINAGFLSIALAYLF